MSLLTWLHSSYLMALTNSSAEQIRCCNHSKNSPTPTRMTPVPFHSTQKCSSKQAFYNARFQVLTAASMKITAFWDVASSSGVDRRFRGAYCIPHTRQNASLNRRSTPTRLHGATSQKALIFKPFASWKLYLRNVIYIYFIARHFSSN
jgi:hypothetical protein